jgi:hypothetical protein
MNPWGLAVAGLGGVAVYVGVRGTQKQVAAMLGFNPGSPATGATGAASGTSGVTPAHGGPSPIVNPFHSWSSPSPLPDLNPMDWPGNVGSGLGVQAGSALRQWLHDRHIWPW